MGQAGVIAYLKKYPDAIWISERHLQQDRFKTGIGKRGHISDGILILADEANRNILCNGWNIVKNILIQENLFFKVLRDKYLENIKQDDHGKLITLYTSSNPNMAIEKWRSILEMITKQLEANMITPGPRTPGTPDKPEEYINGSRYISYRYDDEEGAYKRLQGKLKPTNRKLIGFAKKEYEEAERINNLIEKIAGGVINEGSKTGWPKNDPIKPPTIANTIEASTVIDTASSDQIKESSNDTSFRIK